nr:MAG TPA: hypothetical protein [Caudoviricetes sp.]
MNFKFVIDLIALVTQPSWSNVSAILIILTDGRLLNAIGYTVSSL